jgi:hypothetical protein
MEGVNSFHEQGFSDFEKGAELYDAMRISFEDLTFGKDRDKLGEIAGFVNQFDDALPLIRSAMSSKPTDVVAIDHIFSFVMLQTKRMDLRAKLKQLEDEISLYE